MYWTGIGLSRPSSARIWATVSFVARSPAIMRAGSPGIRWEMTKVTTETPNTTKTRRISRRRIVLAKDMGRLSGPLPRFEAGEGGAPRRSRGVGEGWAKTVLEQPSPPIASRRVPLSRVEAREREDAPSDGRRSHEPLDMV